MAVLQMMSLSCVDFSCLSTDLPGSERCSASSVKARRRRRHVPHSERPEPAVRKRNERERQRAGEVNTAFTELRDRLPSQGQSKRKRLSKINVLKTAIDYIEELTTLLATTGSEWHRDGQMEGTNDVTMSCNYQASYHSQVSPQIELSDQRSYENCHITQVSLKQTYLV